MLPRIWFSIFACCTCQMASLLHTQFPCIEAAFGLTCSTPIEVFPPFSFPFCVPSRSDFNPLKLAQSRRASSLFCLISPQAHDRFDSLLSLKSPSIKRGSSVLAMTTFTPFSHHILNSLSLATHERDFLARFSGLQSWLLPPSCVPKILRPPFT